MVLTRSVKAACDGGNVPLKSTQVQVKRPRRRFLPTEGQSKDSILIANTPPGVWIMLKSWTESERGLYPLWIILSVGFETDMD